MMLHHIGEQVHRAAKIEEALIGVYQRREVLTANLGGCGDDGWVRGRDLQSAS